MHRFTVATFLFFGATSSFAKTDWYVMKDGLTPTSVTTVEFIYNYDPGVSDLSENHLFPSPGRPSEIFRVDKNNLMKSTDFGGTWARFASLSPRYKFHPHRTAMFWKDEDTILVQGADYLTSVFTNDYGKTFQPAVKLINGTEAKKDQRIYFAGQADGTWWALRESQDIQSEWIISRNLPNWETHSLISQNASAKISSSEILPTCGFGSKSPKIEKKALAVSLGKKNAPKDMQITRIITFKKVHFALVLSDPDNGGPYALFKTLDDGNTWRLIERFPMVKNHNVSVATYPLCDREKLAIGFGQTVKIISATGGSLDGRFDFSLNHLIKAKMAQAKKSGGTYAINQIAMGRAAQSLYVNFGNFFPENHD